VDFADLAYARPVMSDSDALRYINDLSHEEERLYSRAEGEGGLSGDEIARLKEIKVELDRCYDLLHQRQARRDAGMDPDEAKIRPASIVEGYEQ
jgi:uncharacterized protein DUF2630